MARVSVSRPLSVSAILTLIWGDYPTVTITYFSMLLCSMRTLLLAFGHLLGGCVAPLPFLCATRIRMPARRRCELRLPSDFAEPVEAGALAASLGSEKKKRRCRGGGWHRRRNRKPREEDGLSDLLHRAVWRSHPDRVGSKGCGDTREEDGVSARSGSMGGGSPALIARPISWAVFDGDGTREEDGAIAVSENPGRRTGL